MSELRSTARVTTSTSRAGQTLRALPSPSVPLASAAVARGSRSSRSPIRNLNISSPSSPDPDPESFEEKVSKSHFQGRISREIEIQRHRGTEARPRKSLEFQRFWTDGQMRGPSRNLKKSRNDAFEERFRDFALPSRRCRQDPIPPRPVSADAHEPVNVGTTFYRRIQVTSVGRETGIRPTTDAHHSPNVGRNRNGTGCRRPQPTLTNHSASVAGADAATCPSVSTGGPARSTWRCVP